MATRSWLWLAVGLACVPLPARSAPEFRAPLRSFDTGAFPRAVAIGDLNSDGKPDLVVANAFYGSGSVTVLLGDGHGDFGTRTDYTTGGCPWSAVIADVNDDGTPDLVVADDCRPIWVMIGRGDGSFSKPIELTGLYGSSVAVSDLNGDGKPDLVSVDMYGTSAVVALGNGDGTFGAVTSFPSGQFGSSVVAGDLNGDGRPDLVVTNGEDEDRTGESVAVLLGKGDGTFGACTYSQTGVTPMSAAIGDLNGDGRADLAVANYWSGTVSVLLGNGDGTFQPKSDINAAGYAFSVAIGDLNEDGRPDLVVSNARGTGVAVLLGNGDGSFREPTAFRTAPLPRAWRSVT